MIERLREFMHRWRRRHAGGLRPLRDGDAVKVAKAPVDPDPTAFTSSSLGPIVTFAENYFEIRDVATGKLVDPATVDTTEFILRRDKDTSISVMHSMVHVVLMHEEPGRRRWCTPPPCKACQVMTELQSKVRGNRDAATWQPSEHDVRLHYEAFRKWYLRTVMSK